MSQSWESFDDDPPRALKVLGIGPRPFVESADKVPAWVLTHGQFGAMSTA